MRLRHLLSTGMVLFSTHTMARLDRNDNQVLPAGFARRGVKGRGDAVPETLYVRADPTATAMSRQPTTSTPYAVPLTTTFVPPESCNQEQLTMLSPPGYFIWLNEPVPVPGTTVSDCYPPEFMSYYTTYHVNPTTVGSLVPLMSPLICPFGWQVLLKDGDYQACCPVGYELTPPETLMDPKRPAYGGTCYSEWPLSSSAFVEVFGSASSSGSILITASTSGFANYAHVIDGIASTSSPTSSAERSGSNASLAPGAIAGIVVGVVAGVGLLVAGFFLLARRRRRQNLAQTPPALPPKDEIALATASSKFGTESLASPHTDVRSLQTGASELAAETRIHELDGGLPVEKP